MKPPVGLPCVLHNTQIALHDFSNDYNRVGGGKKMRVTELPKSELKNVSSNWIPVKKSILTKCIMEWGAQYILCPQTSYLLRWTAFFSLLVAHRICLRPYIKALIELISSISRMYLAAVKVHLLPFYYWMALNFTSYSNIK